MSESSYQRYRDFVQAGIGKLLRSGEHLETSIDRYKSRMQGRTDVQSLQAKLKEDEEQLVQTRTKIDALKKFFVELVERWGKPSDRVIGFVRWAPPIGVGASPSRRPTSRASSGTPGTASSLSKASSPSPKSPTPLPISIPRNPKTSLTFVACLNTTAP